MKQLKLYFKDESCEQISWRYEADNDDVQQGTSIDSAFKQMAQSASDVIFIVPQHWVYETTINVADKNAKQLLAAVAYQLEDQFAEDVENLHFAQGSVVNDSVPFVVIKHSKMQCLLDFEKQHHINATHIINEMAFCASPNAGEVNVYAHEKHFLFAFHGVSKNAICHQDQLEFFLNHCVTQNADLIINKIDKTEFNLLSTPIDLSQCINLKQKAYSQGHVWQELAKNYVTPVILLLFVVIIVLFNFWQSNQQIQTKIDAIQQQQNNLLSQSIKNLSSSSNAKTVLIKALQKQQGSAQQSGFIAAFHQFLMLKKNVKNIKITKVEYRNNKLIVDVSANNLQQLDQLIVSLKSNFIVTVANMDSSNNESQGRFIMENR